MDERLERPVAVKLLHPWAAQDADARSRFRREAAAMARLDHPNVVAVLDYGDDERPWLVQTLCTGGTLAGLIDRVPLPWPRVAELALPIARALAHAHAQGVIHRDLKPSNVLFGAEGHVLVADFGLARLVASSESTITTTGTRLGSPEYWSPEQAAGEPVSERTDLYALGCILYQLATGTLPFPPGEDRLAAGFRRVHEDPPPARSLVPTLPAEADDLLRRLLARDPSARPRAADVVAALQGGELPPVETISAVTTVLPPDTAPTRVIEAPTMVQRPPAEPTLVAPGPPRPGIRLFWGIAGAVLVLAGIVIAIVADGDSARFDLARDGVERVRPLRRDDARAGLFALLGIAIATAGSVVFAIWSVRAADRGRRAATRWVMTVVAVLACALAAGAVVWTAYVAGNELDDLWRVARVR